MTGRELLLAALRNEKTERPAWAPFVGVHGASLIGKTAKEYLSSADCIVDGLKKARELYDPDGLPVVFDLQMEAEILGCDLNWPDDGPPAVTSHPLDGKDDWDTADLPEFSAEKGRFPVAVEATRRLREAFGDEVGLYGLVCGPFTLALHLLGNNIFLEMFDKGEKVRDLVMYCAEVAKQAADAYLEAGSGIIAVVDPMVSQISPEHFQQFVTPALNAVFDHVREQDGCSCLFVCGDATRNLDVMCATTCDCISVDENVSLERLAALARRHGKSFGGNLQLTSVLLLGSETDAQRNAVECMEVAGDTGFILAPGCDLPFATPPKNLSAVAVVVHDAYQRDVVRNMAVEEASGEILDMHEYGQSDKVIVDIITLDSEACAPCQYMVEAVKAVAPEFEGIVEWREHKVKYRESIVFMTSLMVKNIPTICIDGRITFVSRIPPRDELVRAIQNRILEKLRWKISRKRAELVILGDGGDEHRETKERVEKAVQELGAELETRMVMDEKEIMSFGVLPQQTPAVVLTTYTLKSTHRPPETAIIKEWIKDIG